MTLANRYVTSFKSQISLYGFITFFKQSRVICTISLVVKLLSADHAILVTCNFPTYEISSVVSVRSMQKDTNILINVNWGLIYYAEDNQYISALLLRYILNAHRRLRTLNTSVPWLLAMYVNRT